MTLLVMLRIIHTGPLVVGSFVSLTKCVRDDLVDPKLQ